MLNIYLYGASDVCMECETDWSDFESYVGIQLGPVRAHYVFDGDWGIWLEGPIPSDWKVKSIPGNCAAAVRDKRPSGQFIHIQVPHVIDITELQEDCED